MTNAKCPTSEGSAKPSRAGVERRVGLSVWAGMPCERVSVDGLEEPGCGGLPQRLGRIQGLSTQMRALRLSSR
jgi:hypothetical protein